MPNIEKEALHRQSDSIVLGDGFITKGIHRFRQRFDRLLCKDQLHKAYGHNNNITSDKCSDNGKKEINATGGQLGQQHSLQHCQHQGIQHSQQLCLQHEPQHRQHLDQQFERHQELQHRRHLGLQHSRQQGLQIRSQLRRHQERHFEPQHAMHIERQLGCIFIHEIIYLPLA